MNDFVTYLSPMQLNIKHGFTSLLSHMEEIAIHPGFDTISLTFIDNQCLIKFWHFSGHIA